MNSKYRDHTAAFAVAFFIANLLFVGIFYIALWILFARRYTTTTAVGRSHLKQALVASSISLLLFITINTVILLTSGYASVGALFSLEMYFMLIVPLFLIVGILAFTRAVKGQDFSYPLINRLLTQ